jgi:ferredoxin
MVVPLMGDLEEKFAENVPGKYYVTRVCIGCTLCVEIAPGNFRENTDLALAAGNTYVYSQPKNHEEQLQCREAMETCPSSAIRDDGNAGKMLYSVSPRKSIQP